MLRRALLIVHLLTTIATAQTTVHGVEATSGERFRTAEGIAVVIEGIQAPGVEDDATVVSFGGAKARVALDKLIRGQTLTLEIERDRLLPDGERLAHPRREDGTLVAELLLGQGTVRLCLEAGAMRHASALRDAQARAQSAKVGIWARPRVPAPAEPRTYRGVSLGLYAQTSDFDYSPFLDEIRALGASHVAIASPRLMDDWQSNDFWHVEGRSASWSMIDRATRAARARGLAVAYHPLILLRTGTVEHWRGDIAPTQGWLWFRNYARFIGQWADLANDLGVSLLMVGAEFASLEHDTGAWRAIIGNVRSRFAGTLTYSANWDHFEGIGFWDDLDVVGVTGFFPLTKRNDPSLQELISEWARVKQQLLAFQEAVGKPIMLAEIGYASQDGANRDPWNYFLSKKSDHDEQADCFRALFETWRDTPGFQGMFIWNWWRHEDPRNDIGYSVFGKPAYDVIKRAYSDQAARETPEPK
jgi:endonuclease YncB( thermonuclease family)